MSAIDWMAAERARYCGVRMIAADPLAAARLRLPGPDHQPEVYAEARLVAQRLRLAQRQCIGLQPVAGQVAVLAPALLVARALAEQSAAEVVVVAPRLAWPAPPEGALENDGDQVFSALRVAESVLLRLPRAALGIAIQPRILPARRDRAGVSFGDVERVLRHSRERAGFVLLDLTAFRELANLVDGVVLLARAGRTREAQLLRLHRELPAGRELGVVLLGGQSA
jgi:hypothetical protein